MKILVSGYVGKKITGIGRNIIELLDSAPDDYEFIIYVNYDMVNDFKFKNKNVTVKTYNVSKMSSLRNLLWTTFKYPKMAKKENVDVSLIPNFTLLLKKKVPTIIIMHDLIEFNIKNKFSKKKMFYRTKIADPITAKNADHIVTVSENSKRDIIKFLKINENKITVIYDGVDLSKFKKLNREEAENNLLFRNIRSNFLLYVGTVDHPGKNAYSVIKSFEKLTESNKYNGKLVLAGMPGAGFDFIDNYVRNSKYNDRICMLGYVNDVELVSLYSLCDSFIFPSLYEGFGIPPLEALACGAKVIVSNNSSLPEVVGDLGLLVDPNNIEDICTKILESINYNLIDDYEKKLADHLNKFSWKDLSRNFCNVLKDQNKRKLK